ncbi:hypothetical protein HYU95_05495 [Candidatus Daviesbacteria bacterium]|nr:hypothetical protein [Candidatus Daviesbacteria bacterium]
MGAMTEEILELLIDMAFRPYRIVYGYYPKEVSRRSASVAIHRLGKKGLIEKGLVENEICIRLTEKGMQEIQRRKQKEKVRRLLYKDSINKKWDGIWRVVVFDIPEENKRIRNVLRQTLKVLDFKPLQKSVWVSKKNYTKQLREWVNELNLLQYVLIFETKDLGSHNIT